jgi:Mg2+ and Co2+ transporter CorA
MICRICGQGCPDAEGAEGAGHGAHRGYDAHVDDTTRAIDLHLELSADELEELERALLKARATELGEVRRRGVRLTAGYGDATTRDVLDDEGRRAQLRHDALTRLIDALDRSKS